MNEQEMELKDLVRDMFDSNSLEAYEIAHYLNMSEEDVREIMTLL